MYFINLQHIALKYILNFIFVANFKKLSMKKRFTLGMKTLAVVLLMCGGINAQNVSSEIVEFQLLQQPKEVIDANSRTYRVTVTSPYNLTTDDVIKKSKADHEAAVANYANVVAASEKEHQQKLKEHDGEVKKANEKYELEMTEFKKLSMLERLAMTDQGKNPKLVTPAKPEYYKPTPPVYREPNLNDYIIVDNNVLATQIGIEGFTRGNAYVDIMVDIKPVTFQDNAGQTYANQPTKLVVKVNGVEKVNQMFFNDYAFVSSSPSNNINKPLEEKNHLNKVIAHVNDYLNSMYGYQTVKKSVKISSVKNKGAYDDLARADIYVTTNLKKLQANADINAQAYANMQKGIDIWTQTLEKIDYKDKKAEFNAKIGEFVYFNLIRVNLALNKKAEAEKYLNQLQENLIYIKLSYDEENELKRIEQELYKAN
jgi:hypothetical protein